MKHIAITGGIGSGKSYVSRLLKERGIDVYDCDAAAKRLMRTSHELHQRLTSLIGPDAYLDDDADGGHTLNKAAVARFLLASPDNRQAINDIVHPAVAADFMQSGMQWLESAILFQASFQQRVHFDYVVCVTAPEEVRLQRIMARDGISREKALQWLQNQWPQERVLSMADLQIINDGQQPLTPQIEIIIAKTSQPKQ